jgi:hypothetical protein
VLRVHDLTGIPLELLLVAGCLRAGAGRRLKSGLPVEIPARYGTRTMAMSSSPPRAQQYSGSLPQTRTFFLGVLDDAFDLFSVLLTGKT